jgi:hypothetical protein
MFTLKSKKGKIVSFAEQNTASTGSDTTMLKDVILLATQKFFLSL